MIGGMIAWAQSHQEILVRTIREHLNLSLVALAVAIVVALPLGVVLTRRRRIATPVVGLVNTLRTIPSLALLVIMLPLVGTGTVPSVIALVLYGLPAILLNTMTGLGEVDRDVIEAARGQGLSEPQIMARIELPLAAPVILAGIRTGAVQIVSAATLAVFIGGGGLGELISAGMGLMDIPQLMIGALCVALLAAATELLFGGVEWLVARRSGNAPA